MNIKKIIKSYLYRKNIDKSSFIDKSVYVLGWSKVEIGKYTIIGEQSWININHKSGEEARLKIGNYCYLGPFCIISTGKKVVIGDYFLSGHNCRLIGSNHKIDNPCLPYVSTGAYDTDEINIEENVWLGINVIVSGNITIGRGSVVGAGTIVTKNIPPFSIVVGNPGKVIKRFSFIHNKWVGLTEWNSDDENSLPARDIYLAKLINGSINLKLPKLAATRDFGDLL